jgi:hypothetical protein
MHKGKNAYKILVGKFERKRPYGKPRHMWEKNTKIHLMKTAVQGLTGRMGATVSPAYMVIKHSGSTKGWECLDYLTVCLPSVYHEEFCSMKLVISSRTLQQADKLILYFIR